jgi:hypothetical protein
VRMLFIKLLLVVVPVVGWVLLMIHEEGALRPRGTTVAEHLSVMREPTDFGVISTACGEHLAVHGPMSAWLTFPSCGPVYIYGPDGQLLDWTRDAGDDDRFHERWPGVYNGRRLTRDEAARWPDILR